MNRGLAPTPKQAAGPVDQAIAHWRRTSRRIPDGHGRHQQHSDQLHQHRKYSRAHRTDVAEPVLITRAPVIRAGWTVNTPTPPGTVPSGSASTTVRAADAVQSAIVRVGRCGRLDVLPLVLGHDPGGCGGGS